MDACCFIDAVKHSVGALPADRNDDVWHIKELFKAHKRGEIEVITSMLSIAECVAVESGQADVPVEIQKHFRQLLNSGQYLSLAPSTPNTGRVVQNLRWNHGIVVAGADGLHIATALERKAAEFISTDERLRKPKLADAAEKLMSQGIRFIRASETRLLPDDSRQGNLDDWKPKDPW